MWTTLHFLLSTSGVSSTTQDTTLSAVSWAAVPAGPLGEGGRILTIPQMAGFLGA
jgi:hypothetical protein